jgi:enoyl-CoA hydratase
MTTDVITRTWHGTVLVATIDRPAKANSLNQEVIDALDALAADIEDGTAEQEVRALVLTGAGDRAFSAGADISELDGIGEAAAYRQMRRGQEVFGRIEALPVAVIVALNGVALGGGLELAMAADVRIAAPTARLGQAEITLENLPGWGGTQRLPRLVGRGRATELILTGDLLDAATAAEWGLVNRVADDPLAAAIELAQRIALRSPVAVAGAKRAIAAGLAPGLQEGLEVEARGVGESCATDAQRAAVQAFLARKRR